MRQQLILTTLSVLCSTLAVAAPMTGLYVGTGVSGGDLMLKHVLKFDGNKVKSVPLENSDEFAMSNKISGHVFGGYGYAYNKGYIGGELMADFDKQSADVRTADTIITFNKGNTYSLNLHLGYFIAPEVLVYGIAGLGLTDIEGQVSFIPGRKYSRGTMLVKDTPLMRENNSLGKHVGLGIGANVTEHLNLRAEYRHIHYGDTLNTNLKHGKYDFFDPIGEAQLSFNQNVLSLALTYQF